MDIDFPLYVWRSAATVASLLVFLAMVKWAYSRRQSRAFQEAAERILLDDELTASPAHSSTVGKPHE